MAAHTTGLGETMFIAEQMSEPTNDFEVYTIDHRDVSSRGRWKGAAEGAYQFGRFETKAVEAWGGYARVDYQVTPKWTLFTEANVASGGSSATQTHTFDTLQELCSNHKNYGQMDMQGWENMKQLELGVQFTPDKKLDIGFQWHALELYDAKDAWYDYAGSINAGPGGNYIDPTGAKGKDIGQVLDLTGTYWLNRDLQLQFGLASFLPGGFIKAFNGSETCNEYWAYFGITAKY
jgi:hypothetical protein